MNGAWGVRRNYHAHAAEMGGVAPSTPLFFFMPATAVVEADGGGNVAMALGREENQIEHEVELVVKLDCNLKPVMMAVGCDTTDRTVQAEANSKGESWLEAKGFPGAAVVGTWVPYQMGEYDIGISVNGEVRQNSNTSLMVHSVDSILNHLSGWYDREPGAFVWTGTPEGVSPMQQGDEIYAWMKDGQGKIISKLNAVCK